MKGICTKNGLNRAPTAAKRIKRKIIGLTEQTGRVLGQVGRIFLFKAQLSVSLREIKTKGGKEYGGEGDQ